MASVEDGGQKATCEWTPKAVSCLLQAYGEKYALGQTYLKIKDWEDVVNSVNEHSEAHRDLKTLKQCRDKVDSLKKRYKLEKRKAIVAGVNHSSWPFFAKLNQIMIFSPKPAKADAIGNFQHQIPRITSGSKNVKERMVSPDHDPLDSSYEKLEEHCSDSFHKKSEELGSGDHGFREDSNSWEDTESSSQEHSDTESSPRNRKTTMEEGGFSEGPLNCPSFLKKGSPNSRAESQETLDAGSCRKKVERDSKVQDSLTARRKICKERHPIQSLADAIVGFSQVYARIELAKMELYTSMNLGTAKLRMKDRKGKRKPAWGSDQARVALSHLDSQFLLNL